MWRQRTLFRRPFLLGLVVLAALTSMGQLCLSPPPEEDAGVEDDSGDQSEFALFSGSEKQFIGGNDRRLVFQYYGHDGTGKPPTTIAYDMQTNTAKALPFKYFDYTDGTLALYRDWPEDGGQAVVVDLDTLEEFRYPVHVDSIESDFWAEAVHGKWLLGKVPTGGYRGLPAYMDRTSGHLRVVVDDIATVSFIPGEATLAADGNWLASWYFAIPLYGALLDGYDPALINAFWTNLDIIELSTGRRTPVFSGVLASSVNLVLLTMVGDRVVWTESVYQPESFTWAETVRFYDIETKTTHTLLESVPNSTDRYNVRRVGNQGVLVEHEFVKGGHWTSQYEVFGFDHSKSVILQTDYSLGEFHCAENLVVYWDFLEGTWMAYNVLTRAMTPITLGD